MSHVGIARPLFRVSMLPAQTQILRRSKRFACETVSLKVEQCENIVSLKNEQCENIVNDATCKNKLDQAWLPASSRVDIQYLPLPWHGRLGYACLNTILRAYQEPVFCSRTCRLDSIVKNELLDLQNGKGKGGGLRFLKALGKQNATDLAKIIEWNEQHGIKFLRISSEMFPFAAHQVWSYDLKHVTEELRHAGELCMKYNHRLTTHPGQFTQIASPNPEIFVRAACDLEHHAEIFEKLQLQGQIDANGVIVIHLGGTYGDKSLTLERFRENYAKLSDRVRKRLVLENDDVCWTVRDLLPLCEELNIPMVLDWHHNLVLCEDDFPPGSKSIQDLLPRIAATWSRKGIKQKQHYSESREPEANCRMKLRAHSNRVYNLPPCDPYMDLMIEAKDKEQAVFEIAKKFKLECIKIPDTVEYQENDTTPLHLTSAAYWPEGQQERLKRKKVKLLQVNQ